MKAVILAGGTGTRLWPLSRVKEPKQFQRLISDKTMLQETIERLDFLNKNNIYISTNREYEEIVKKQSKGTVHANNIIIEPALRDTAPCIGLAATYLSKKFPNEVMAVIYADHHIQKKHNLIKKLRIAEKIAKEEDTLNIIEVKATYPNVNLGYVKIGKMIGTKGDSEIYGFEGFTEKPDQEKAKQFLKSYRYLWNTGLYVWKISTILKHYKTYQPEIYKNLMKIKCAIGTKNEKRALETYYPKCKKISVDYGIMEKVGKKNVRIIPAELGWSDVGTWKSIFDETSESEEENIVKGEHMGLDSTGSLIYGTGEKLIATIGIKDLIIVETKDALLICKKKRSQDVKKLVENLKKTKHKNLL